jgi:hypothetical protein
VIGWGRSRSTPPPGTGNPDRLGDDFAALISGITHAVVLCRRLEGLLAAASAVVILTGRADLCPRDPAHSTLPISATSDEETPSGARGRRRHDRVAG